MTTSLIPLLSFVLISTFTPGPSNISSASMSVLHGYRNTLKYQAGLAAGVLLLMFASGLLSTSLLSVFPAFEPIMRYAGAGYIIYLAFGILRATYTFADRDSEPLGFVHGLTLQILNPKLIVYAFTLFSAFLAPMDKNMALSLAIIMMLVVISFCATSVWALFGTVIKRYLRSPRLRIIVNVCLSLALVYTAISITGLI